ncbi:MAG: prolyl oligopeptidase family serine peptidase [Alphaproteobacteria bacterium]
MRTVPALGFILVLGFGALATAAQKDAKDNDPFLWLSDINGARAMAWVEKQNTKSAALKEDLGYANTYDAILKSLDTHDRIPKGTIINGHVYNFWQDETHVRGIWRRTSVAEYRRGDPRWEILFDLDRYDAETNANWVFHGATCAPSMQRCLLDLSPGGTDAGAIREYDPKTQRFLDDGFALAVAKSNVDYVDDNTIIFGTDFGPGSMTTSGYPRIVKVWRRGEPIADARTVFEGKVEDQDSHAQVYSGPNGLTAGTATVLIVRDVSFFQAEYHLVRPGFSTVKLPLPTFANVQGITRGFLVFTLREDWSTGGETYRQGSLLAFALRPFVDQGAKRVSVLYVPNARSTVEHAATGARGVYAAIFTNVIGSVHFFRPDRDGTWKARKLAIPDGGTTAIVSADDWGSEAHFTHESFLTPPTLYEDRGDNRPIAIKSQAPQFDANLYLVEQFEVASADGVKVPYFLIRAKDATGPMPTILYGYGGFEQSLFPWYWNEGRRPVAPAQAWLSRGGAIAVANIRGGGEFGPAWHQAALKEKRQRAFDDFAAVAKDTQARGVTAPERLGIVGASNGGVLTTVTMTQHPELVRAVVCQRPLVDMLRYTRFGAGASWIEEYGDPDKPDERAYLAKYSAYQNVKRGAQYPSIFFITETSDDRVTPIWARMMAAKMEAQGHDVLFYESAEGGHGAGATNAQQAEYWALSYTYFAQKLGLGAGRAAAAKPASP